jgi:hypothetical protein
MSGRDRRRPGAVPDTGAKQPVAGVDADPADDGGAPVVLDEAGKRLQGTTVPCSRESLEGFARASLSRDDQVALEATTNPSSSRWVGSHVRAATYNAGVAPKTERSECPQPGGFPMVHLNHRMLAMFCVVAVVTGTAVAASDKHDDGFRPLFEVDDLSAVRPDRCRRGHMER